MNNEQIKCEMKGSYFFVLGDIKILGLYCLSCLFSEERLMGNFNNFKSYFESLPRLWHTNNLHCQTVKTIVIIKHHISMNLIHHYFTHHANKRCPRYEPKRRQRPAQKVRSQTATASGKGEKITIPAEGMAEKSAHLLLDNGDGGRGYLGGWTSTPTLSCLQILCLNSQ